MGVAKVSALDRPVEAAAGCSNQLYRKRFGSSWDTQKCPPAGCFFSATRLNQPMSRRLADTFRRQVQVKKSSWDTQKCPPADHSSNRLPFLVKKEEEKEKEVVTRPSNQIMLVTRFCQNKVPNLERTKMNQIINYKLMFFNVLRHFHEKFGSHLIFFFL